MGSPQFVGTLSRITYETLLISLGRLVALNIQIKIYFEGLNIYTTVLAYM